jgi:hypothetical protein
MPFVTDVGSIIGNTDVPADPNPEDYLDDLMIFAIMI